MKITDLKVTPVALPIETPLIHAWGIHPGFGRIIVEVETDEGIVGLGECSLSPSGRQMEEVLKSCKAHVVGEDPFHLERLRWKIARPFYVRMFGSNLINAFAAIEFACLDIQGKAIGRPVHDLLGGKLRDEVPFTAYLFYRHFPSGSPFSSPAEEMVKHATDLAGRFGFDSLKIKGGVYPPEQEIETFIALRERFPAAPIRIDPNSVWSVATSVRVARRLKDYDMEYLEDPTWGLRGMAEVKKMVPWLALASNMAVFGYEDIAPAVEMKAVDVVLSDPHWYGGLRATKELARVCETFSLDMGMHSGTELGVSLAAILHLASSLPHLSHAPDAHYHYLPDDVIKGGKLPYEKGRIRVPEGPGLGVELDRDKLQTYHDIYEQFMRQEQTELRSWFEPLITKPRW